MTRLPRRAHDDAGGQPRLCADGTEHGHGSRSPTATGDGRHRGVISAMVMSLLVLRVLYMVFKGRLKTGW